MFNRGRLDEAMIDKEKAIMELTRAYEKKFDGFKAELDLTEQEIEGDYRRQVEEVQRQAKSMASALSEKVEKSKAQELVISQLRAELETYKESRGQLSKLEADYQASSRECAELRSANAKLETSIQQLQKALGKSQTALPTSFVTNRPHFI